ncbi:DUF1700 domain-containing protein [Massilia niabensis]|uniref:DUF1700 domain-containing protein n=1 Tax=Massilia niabensis TaxID=544910 RepID=A0ABW0LAI9_9BURK
MGKLEYLDALKRSMLGLPPELQAKTLAWYEQRFVDGMAAGRAEADIASELDDPKKVALTLRANTHMHAFAEQKNPANLVRMLVSAVGLLIFNLFMLIPAAVVGSLLAALYVSAFAFYVGGIAVTASGLSGANELVLDGPLREVIEDGGRDEDAATRISIGETGIHVRKGSSETVIGEARDGADSPSRVVRGAERVAGRGIHITTEMDEESRATQTALGLASVLGGIVLFLVSLVLTRYAALGVRRYVQMNLSLLRGA